MLKNQIPIKKPFVCQQKNIYPFQTKHMINHNLKKQQKQIKRIGSILGEDQNSKSLSKLDLKDQQKRTKGHSKIKQISQLINTHNTYNIQRQDKNFCTTKSINLNNLQNIPKNEKKKKLQVSLSKQKASNRERSASQRSGNKGTKLKVSLNENFSHNKSKTNLIRKIKDFQISNEQKQQINKAKTARMIKNIPQSPTQDFLIRKQQKTKQHKINSTINISINVNNQEYGMFQRRKIRLHRNR